MQEGSKAGQLNISSVNNCAHLHFWVDKEGRARKTRGRGRGGKSGRRGQGAGNCWLSIEWHKKRSRTNNNVDDNVYDDNDDADADDDAGNGDASSDCNDDADDDDEDEDDVCLMVDVVVYKLTFVVALLLLRSCTSINICLVICRHMHNDISSLQKPRSPLSIYLHSLSLSLFHLPLQNYSIINSNNNNNSRLASINRTELC